MTATTAAPYAIHYAAKPAALLLGLFTRVEDDMPPPFDGLPREQFELRMIRAGLKIADIRQDELARRLGVDPATLSHKLRGARPATDLDRFFMAVAIFVSDREEMARIQGRCAGYDLDEIDRAWLAPTEAARAAREGRR